jgi:RimJ/RimL family protein N-acetyltransferase
MTLRDRTEPGIAGARKIRALATERLILRAPEVADVEAIASLASDRRIAENTLRIPHPYGRADARAFIASANSADGEAAFLICARAGQVLGACGIAKLDGETPEIGYWLGLPFWGNGYATEAARAVIDDAFAGLGHAVLLGGARVSNPASRRVLEKCGFQWTGVALHRIRALRSSAPVDRFRLDRDRWKALALDSVDRTRARCATTS